MTQMKWTGKITHQKEDITADLLPYEKVKEVITFHKSFPEYQETPLVSLPIMANYMKVNSIHIKDESFRFGLNAFKVLGASYAIANYLSKQLNIPIGELSYQKMQEKEVKSLCAKITFYTATDGNHGRGVAWAAKMLGAKAVVVMPKGSSLYRQNQIIQEGAVCTIEEKNYDDCVRIANDLSEKDPYGVIIQDTAWDEYVAIPTWIIQGYSTMAYEADLQLQKSIGKPPTHVFLQAGVGSMASAVTAYFVNRYPDFPPKIILMEASSCDCFFQTAEADDGTIRNIKGDLSTVMAGLSCGEVNPIAISVLPNYVDAYFSVPDSIAIKSMKMLAFPLGDDPSMVAGESGALGIGVLEQVCRNEGAKICKQYLGLDENSNVLLFSTEGDTDPNIYKSLVNGT